MASSDLKAKGPLIGAFLVLRISYNHPCYPKNNQDNKETEGCFEIILHWRGIGYVFKLKT